MDYEYDLVICHNVLEYVDDKDEYVKAFLSVLKDEGSLSLVKHNHIGRIMQRVVFENNLELAMQELSGQSVVVQNFGDVKYYELRDVEQWSRSFGFDICEIFGIRTFFGLIQDNDIKYDSEWQNNMLKLEQQTCQIESFRNIAFYHHIILS